MSRGRVIVNSDVASDFTLLARDLRRAGARTLQKELHSGLQRAAQPTLNGVRKSAALRLPKSGGLAKRVATSNIRVASAGAFKGQGARIRFVAQEKKGASYDAPAMDKGRLRHPLFGRKGRKKWFTQRVTPGFFTKPIQARQALFQRELARAVDAVERQISNGE